MVALTRKNRYYLAGEPTPLRDIILDGDTVCQLLSSGLQSRSTATLEAEVSIVCTTRGRLLEFLRIDRNTALGWNNCERNAIQILVYIGLPLF